MDTIIKNGAIILIVLSVNFVKGKITGVSGALENTVVPERTFL
jgi:hypothetical protein